MQSFVTYGPIDKGTSRGERSWTAKMGWTQRDAGRKGMELELQ